MLGPAVTLTDVGSRLPSTSVSLARTGTVIAVSSAVVAVSSPATGVSLTGVTSMETEAVSQRMGVPVSHTSYENESKPAKFSVGV